MDTRKKTIELTQKAIGSRERMIQLGQTNARTLIDGMSENDISDLIGHLEIMIQNAQNNEETA